jgi:hypothetical protein
VSSTFSYDPRQQKYINDQTHQPGTPLPGNRSFLAKTFRFPSPAGRLQRRYDLHNKRRCRHRRPDRRHAEYQGVVDRYLPAESYLDTGHRSNFANADGPIALHPDFASRIWDAEGCAPLVVTGAELDAARRWVAALAVAA